MFFLNKNKKPPTSRNRIGGEQTKKDFYSAIVL